MTTGPVVLVALAVFARVAAALEAAAPVLLPSVTTRTRLSLAGLISLAGLPVALTVSGTTISTGQSLGNSLASCGLLIAGEACIGLGMGLAVAMLVSVGGWAGEILASASGIGWDDGEEEGAGAGIGRLAWWVGLGAFLAAGGLEVTVIGLIDSTRMVPVGILASPLAEGATDTMAAIGSLGSRVPAMAIGMAAAIAIPALSAALAFQLTAAVCLRAAPCDPGPGLVQAAMAVVLLISLHAGAAGWAHSVGDRVIPLISDCFMIPMPPGVSTAPASASPTGIRR